MVCQSRWEWDTIRRDAAAVLDRIRIMKSRWRDSTAPIMPCLLASQLTVKHTSGLIRWVAGPAQP